MLIKQQQNRNNKTHFHCSSLNNYINFNEKYAYLFLFYEDHVPSEL